MSPSLLSLSLSLVFPVYAYIPGFLLSEASPAPPPPRRSARSTYNPGCGNFCTTKQDSPYPKGYIPRRALLLLLLQALQAFLLRAHPHPLPTTPLTSGAGRAAQEKKTRRDEMNPRMRHGPLPVRYKSSPTGVGGIQWFSTTGKMMKAVFLVSIPNLLPSSLPGPAPLLGYSPYGPTTSIPYPFLICPAILRFLHNLPLLASFSPLFHPREQYSFLLTFYQIFRSDQY